MTFPESSAVHCNYPYDMLKIMVVCVAPIHKIMVIFAPIHLPGSGGS